MTVVLTDPSPKSLLAAVPYSQRTRLLRACESAEMVVGDILCEAGQPPRYAYFPHNGLISQVTTLDGHKPLETGLIGQAGMLGVTGEHGVNELPMRAVVQSPGLAMRIPVGGLRRAVRSSPGLRQALKRYLYIRLVELSLTAACTRFHQIDQRLARWLLLSLDRLPDNRLVMTQEPIANMLGVRREGVTEAAHKLQEQGIILNVVVGIVGAMIGGWLIGPLLGAGSINEGLSVMSFVVSLIGAVILRSSEVRTCR